MTVRPIKSRRRRDLQQCQNPIGLITSLVLILLKPKILQVITSIGSILSVGALINSKLLQCLATAKHPRTFGTLLLISGFASMVFPKLWCATLVLNSKLTLQKWHKLMVLPCYQQMPEHRGKMGRLSELEVFGSIVLRLLNASAHQPIRTSMKCLENSAVPQATVTATAQVSHPISEYLDTVTDCQTAYYLMMPSMPDFLQKTQTLISNVQKKCVVPLHVHGHQRIAEKNSKKLCVLDIDLLSPSTKASSFMCGDSPR